ncbi:TnsA endonuclease N-terminal domain-containing protein [Paraburkholderia strydomiana]|uniref:TnsA endonuclease N-terminal domain-containing protein n=1 Tax=Paraburkholderia strydomiana TaxID=1245417 RepID=UPI0038BB46C9
MIDIREQFPLLPLSPIQDVGRQRGIRYPLYAQTTVPFVMTTDFVVTVQQDDGSAHEFARTVKYTDKLVPGTGACALWKAFPLASVSRLIAAAHASPIRG